MLYYSGNVIEAMKENRKREVTQQVELNHQLREARENRSKHSKGEASFLKAAKRRMGHVTLNQRFRSSELVGGESQ